jgi:tetratricopeptide (TPR) repeat protein
MAEEQGFWTEARLKSGITWLIVGIIAIVLAGAAGYWYYYLKPVESTPRIIEKAINEALAAAKKNPNDLGPHITLAQLYIQDKRFDDAIVECKLILKIDKKNEYGMSLMGVAYEAKGNITTAIKYYKQAIATADVKQWANINPARKEAMFRLGKIYIDQKKYDDAIKIFDPMVKADKMDADSRYFLGVAYLRKGEADKAIELLLVATRYVPNYYEAQFALGQAYEKKGDKASAIKAYEMALKYKSDYTEAQDALNRLK